MKLLRPTVADIDNRAFTGNLGVVRDLSGSGVDIMAVIKADAYGHGSLPLARAAESFGCPILGVATVEEGIRLRQGGIRAGILVLGGISPGAEMTSLENRLSAVVHDLDSAERLNTAASVMEMKCPVHLKIDTGMGRLGFLPDDVQEAVYRIKDMEALDVEGVMTHFARADEADEGPTEKQSALFEAALREVRLAGIEPAWVHVRNSAAILLDRGPSGNLVRPGIMLYGSLPPEMKGTAWDYGLKNVLTFRTAIIQLQDLPDGWAVSYGGRYVASGKRKIAVIAAGYADGFLRYNRGGDVLVRGSRAPVAGTVCMDMCMVDVTGIPNVSAGDEVVIVGRQGKEYISAAEVARRGGTISYEFFCGISARVPRRHFNQEGS